MKQIRDLIAHGKAEKLRGEVEHSFYASVPYPSSQLRELAVSKDTLAIVLPNIEEFLDAIQRGAKPLLKIKDEWFGDQALQGPSWYMNHSTTLNPDADHPNLRKGVELD